jgi:protein-disulfide isomerase
MYGQKVRIVYMDFPLTFHPEAMDAAIAARCAGEQGRFWPYHDAMLSGTAGLSKPALKQLAQSLDLHAETFDRCLDGRKSASAVEADLAEGRQLGVTGTPTFIINGHPVFGTPALPSFEKIIDANLATGARN